MNEQKLIDEVTDLLTALIPDIGDEYRASDDPDDDQPGMMVTIATNDGEDWTWQTGDNSFMGSCYHYRHWGVGYLYRDTDCRDLAESMVDDMLEGVYYEQDLQEPN